MTALSDWMKEIDRTLVDINERPQFKTSHPFPLDEVKKHLKHLFKQPSLEIEVTTQGWIPPEKLFEGMSEKKIALSILFTPLTTPLYFATTDQALKFLMSDLLGGEEACAPFFETPEMLGFFHYLGLEVISLIDQTHFAGNLKPEQQEAPHFEKTVSKTECFVVDVFCKGAKSSFSGRLFLPRPFRKEWNSHFATSPQPKLSKEEREKIPVEIALEVGSGKLTLEEWKNVKEGDFVLLEQTSYDIESHKGRVILSLNGTPLFRGKLQGEGIKLLEYPIYEEVKQSMDDKFNDQEELDLYGDVEDEGDVEAPEEGKQSFEKAKPEETVSPDKIPILLTVEAGRLRMTAEELMNLSPGHIIDLKVHPEQGVDLVVNGKRVGKGELVKIGEVLGLRILKL